MTWYIGGVQCRGPQPMTPRPPATRQHYPGLPWTSLKESFIHMESTWNAHGVGPSGWALSEPHSGVRGVHAADPSRYHGICSSQSDCREKVLPFLCATASAPSPLATTTPAKLPDNARRVTVQLAGEEAEEVPAGAGVVASDKQTHGKEGRKEGRSGATWIKKWLSSCNRWLKWFYSLGEEG